MKLCWLGIHKWSQWKIIRRGTFVVYPMYTKIVQKPGDSGQFIEQERKCDHCGKTQLNDQTT
jgi:hypothetical protein